MKTVDLYKRIGVQSKDLPIQLDLPPTYHTPKPQRLALVHQSAEFYWRMVEHIPFVVPVVHGWDYEELSASLELLEDPDKLAAGSNLATASRNNIPDPIGAGAFLQSGRYVLDEAGNLKKGEDIGAGAFMNVGGNAVDHVTSNKSTLVGAGAYSPVLYPWSMGNLNPHSCARDRILSVGGFLQSGQWVADHLANTPARKVDRVKSTRRDDDVIAAAYPSNADVGWKNTILTNGGMKRKKKNVISAGTFNALTTSETI